MSCAPRLSSTPCDGPSASSASVPSGAPTETQPVLTPPAPAAKANLPAPEHVREHGTELHSSWQTDRRVWSISWEGREMVVKGGADVHADEAETTRLARRRTGLPVPEVYGLRKDGNATYIYFEKLSGAPLTGVFHQHPEETKHQLLLNVQQMLQSLRAAQPIDNYVGTAGSYPFAPILPSYRGSVPSLPTSAALHNWLHEHAKSCHPEHKKRYKKLVKPALRRFERDPLVFTHGDLHSGNILVHEGQITGVVDWERAGWYPPWVESFSLLGHALNGNRKADWFLLEQLVGKSVDPSSVEEKLGWMLAALDSWEM
ncbi:hypothetical protein JCM10207_004800 [Rhodosporidiobolus poonsookiae]